MSSTTTIVMQITSARERLTDLRDLTMQAHCAINDIPMPSSSAGGERVSSSSISRPTERAALDGGRSFKRRRVDTAAKALDEALVQLDVARSALLAVIGAE